MTDLAPLNFVNAAEAASTFNVLLYGPPKAGKTSAAMTAPGPIPTRRSRTPTRATASWNR